MRTRLRILPFALAVAAIAAVAGCTPPPSSSTLTSPVYGWSSATTVVQLNTCSAAGGPVTVTIVDREDIPGTTLQVEPTINLGGQPFDTYTYLTDVGQSWTSLPLPAHSCFAVTLLGGPRFRYRIDW